MFRMNGMSRSQGCERVTMFRMNGQVISSRHNLSTDIHVGNVTITGSFLAIRGFTTLVNPSMSCERVTMFRMNGQIISSRHNLSTDIHVRTAFLGISTFVYVDERSGLIYIFKNLKYTIYAVNISGNFNCFGCLCLSH